MVSGRSRRSWEHHLGRRRRSRSLGGLSLAPKCFSQCVVLRSVGTIRTFISPFLFSPTSFCSLPLNASLVYAMYARGILPLSLHLPPIAYSFSPPPGHSMPAPNIYFLVCCVLFCVKRSLFPAFPIQISDVQKNTGTYAVHELYRTRESRRATSPSSHSSLR